MTAKKLSEIVAVLDRYYAAYRAANGKPCPFRVLRRGGYFYCGDQKQATWHGLPALLTTVRQLEARAALTSPVTVFYGQQETSHLCKDLHAAFELNHNVLGLSLDQLRRMAAIMKEAK